MRKTEFSRKVERRELPVTKAPPLRVASNSAVAEPTAVEMMRDMLERCERGEVTFVAVVGQLADGSVIDGWSNAKACRPFSVVGALTYIAQKFAIHNID